MKFKRSLACLFIVAAFPLMAPLDQNNAAPFAMVALAGHTLSGGGVWCQCGCTACICDPGETPGACTNSIKPIQKQSDDFFDQSASPVGKASASDFDFSAGTMLLALAFLVWMRLRG